MNTNKINVDGASYLNLSFVFHCKKIVVRDEVDIINQFEYQ